MKITLDTVLYILCRVKRATITHDFKSDSVVYYTVVTGHDPFNQTFRKFRSKTQWIGSVQPEKFRKNGSTFWGGPLFPVGPVGILVEWIAPTVSLPGSVLFPSPGAREAVAGDWDGRKIPWEWDWRSCIVNSTYKLTSCTFIYTYTFVSFASYLLFCITCLCLHLS